ncbi:MAG TPA: pentapeptide repeat-containing protein [Polyangiaceae bacterium]|nr:pentapeptide repeat-containing protein [Polyangiaceae bacterium]
MEELEEIEEAARETRTLVLAGLGSVAFAAVGAASVRDWELLSGSGTVTLPVLSVAVSVPMFFYVAPLFLLLCFVYIQSEIERLARRADARRLSVWPLSQLPWPRRSEGQMVSILTQLLVWTSWPVVIGFCAFRTLPLGDRWLAAWNVMLTFASSGIALHYWTKVRGQLTSAARIASWALVAIGAAGVVVCDRTNECLRDLPVRFSDFRKAEVGSIDLTARNLSRASFDRASMEHAKLCRANLDHASLLGAHARGAEFSCGGATPDLETVDFGDAELMGAKMWNATLHKGSFSADLSGADLSEANFDECHAEHAIFQNVRGTRAGFFRATLSYASFARASLKDPNFTSAHLDHVAFAEATLTGARLAGADLTEANLCGADLTGMDITPDTNFTGATFDKFTVLPPWFDPRGHGMAKRN